MNSINSFMFHFESISNRFVVLFLLIVGLLLLEACSSTGRLSVAEPQTNFELSLAERGDFRMMFYNVENLFDPFNDTLTMDDEFTPEGIRHWTWERYREKCLKIGKVIVALGGWEAPELVGLCEVENRFVLDGVITYGPLSQLGYRVVHRDSPDRRGIDVALLYQADRFRPIRHQFLSVVYPGQKKSETREILYVKGVTHTQDTLHVYVNHWPSRWGGQLESETKRMAAAQILRNSLDSLIRTDKDPLVFVMGDFNDYPNNVSLSKVLGAQIPTDSYQSTTLYNLASPLHESGWKGSHKYGGKWGMLDQIIVSGAVLKGKGVLRCSSSDMQVFQPSFLLEEDAAYYGKKPFRTFNGYRFNGGFSDHLPVYLDLWRK